MQKTLILAVLFLVPLFAFGKTIEFPIDSGRMVEIDAYGNIIEPSFIWKLFNVNGWSVWSIQVVQASEKTQREVIEDYVDILAERFGISAERVKKIINCESRFDVKALNLKDTDGFPKYSLLQFHKPTFYGAGGKDIWNWREQLEIGMKMMADGLWNKWPVCSGLKTYEELTR